MRRRDIIIFSSIFLFLCVSYFIWSILITEPGFPLDDSWIHLVFARNIATGHGFSFNPGVPISGATAPLWTLILVPFWWIMGPIAAGIIPAIILELLAIIALYKLTELIFGQRIIAFWVTFIVTLTWIFVWGALSGMEIGLYSALSLWGLYFYFKSKSLNDRWSYIACALLVLAIPSRPESGLILAAVLIRDFITWIKSQSRSILPWIWRAIIAAIILSPYFVFNYTTSGMLFPQTFSAITGNKGLFSAIIRFDLARIVKTLTVFPLYSIEYFFFKLLVLNPILILGLAPAILKISGIQDELRSKRMMLAALILLYFPLLGTFTPLPEPGYHNFRRMDNLIPLIYVFSLGGLFLTSGVKAGNIPKNLKVILIAFAGLGAILIVASGVLIEVTASYLIHDQQFFAKVGLNGVKDFVRLVGQYLIIMPLIILVGLYLFLGKMKSIWENAKYRNILLGILVAYCIGFLIYGGDRYSNDVKNINECDKAAGIYLKGIMKPGELVAINDIGAIKYFSNVDILDLEGLVSHEITTDMIYNDSLAFEYMYHRRRPEYVAIFPSWFRYIPTRTDILKPIKMFIPERNTILGGDTTIVYKAIWPADSMGRHDGSAMPSGATLDK